MKTETAVNPQHTPTPWKVTGELDSLKIIAESKEEYACDDTLVIANVVPGDFEIAEYGHCKANAAFIVRATNNFDKMLDLLKEARDTHLEDCTCDSPQGSGCFSCRVARAIDEAEK